ncbi:type IV pilin N-terminal domain-containing protein [Halorhabdus sp. BNX81]|uniref:type IV pilin N-terminal domain-containing protein n=1 Tax=Halorhabdus sp. BNX81 TaxID=2980181 RepID=UPI0023DCEF48|nr:type IV pilin N-terminal domain-containing protein [Halorhabdus sp. BNX81]
MHSKVPQPSANRGVISILALLMLFGSAILGTFVLGLGPEEPTAPNAQLDFEADDAGAVTISHEGGDMLLQSEIEIQSPGSVSEWPGREITAGDEITVSGLESGDTIAVIWNSPDGDMSAIIATYTVS